MNWYIAIPAILITFITTFLILAVRTHRIKLVFGIPWYYWLFSADIAGQKAVKPLIKDGVIGSPDGIFFNPLKWQLVICEFKSRRFNKKCTLRERYQIQLYLGMAKSWYCPKVIGRIAYSGGTLIVPFEPIIYKSLINLIPEAVQATKTWQLKDSRPLHRRMKIPWANYKKLKLPVEQDKNQQAKNS